MLSLHAAAAKINKNLNFDGLRVHGLLADMETFHFYSYDQTQRKFTFDEILQVNSTREMFIADMINGMCFSHLSF